MKTLKVIKYFVKFWFWMECMYISYIFFPPFINHCERMAKLNLFRELVVLGVEDVLVEQRNNGRAISEK